jgi:hypothetical protein
MLRRSCDRAIGLDVCSILLLGLIDPLFLELESGTTFLNERHSFNDHIAALRAMSDASPRPAVPLNVGALRACNIAPMLVKVGLVDTELPDVARSNNLGGRSADRGVASKPYLATALWYVLGARDILDPGERLGAPSRVLAAAGH